jgi:hypothetical protein
VVVDAIRYLPDRRNSARNAGMLGDWRAGSVPGTPLSIPKWQRRFRALVEKADTAMATRYPGPGSRTKYNKLAFVKWRAAPNEIGPEFM